MQPATREKDAKGDLIPVPVDQITRADALKFRKWWSARVEGGMKIESANKDFGHLHVKPGSNALVVVLGSFVGGAFRTEDRKCNLCSEDSHNAAIAGSSVLCQLRV